MDMIGRIQRFMAQAHDDGDEVSAMSDVSEVLHRHPVHIIFKHSPLCGFSERASGDVDRYATLPDAVPVTVVDVLSQRALSRGIEATTRVRHESPQVLLVCDGMVRWHASHRGVTTDALTRATQDAGTMPHPPAA